jgi:uncharacterized protein (TIGR02594 family)
MQITAYDLAQRFVGLKEVSGTVANPAITAMLSLDQASFILADEVPWCSGFTNYVAWLLRLPRSKSLAARSWLGVGHVVDLHDPLHPPKVGFDVVILQRGDGPQPDATVMDAPGHVGFFSAIDATHVTILGGNQGNAVSLARFPVARILGMRRLLVE